jgi:integrase
MSARRTKVEKHSGVYYRLGRDGERQYEITWIGLDELTGTKRRRWLRVPGKLDDALAALEAERSKARAGERTPSAKDARRTLREVADGWLEAQAHLRPRTREGYRQALHRHVYPTLGSRRIADVTVDDVAALVVRLRAKGLAGWTIRGVLTPLSGVLGHAARRGLVSHNAVSRLERRERPAIERREMRVLDRDEIAALIAAAPERYRTLIALSIGTGLRQGEALGLRWQDIDLANGVLRVRWQRDQDGRLAEPKTANARREVVLSPGLVSTLRLHKAASGHSQEADFVFASLAGTPLAHRNVVRRGLEKATEAAGVGEYVVDENGKRSWRSGLRWHDLRHTAASLLIAQGLDVVYVSRTLGHADPGITLKRYAHLWDAHAHGDRARAAQDAALGNVLETAGGDTPRNPAVAASATPLEQARSARRGNA